MLKATMHKRAHTYETGTRPGSNKRVVLYNSAVSIAKAHLELPRLPRRELPRVKKLVRRSELTDDAVLG
ncbi:hypothetical protein Plhal304r1_c063g0150211 [Plasmopara halstedii]